MMRKYDTKEILDKFLGNLVAQGEEHTDTEVSLNVDEAEDIINALVFDLASNAVRIDYKQASVHHIAVKSYNILKLLHTELTAELKVAKQKLYKDDYTSVKYKNLTSPLHIYQVADTDTIISPYNKEYTLEWYNKEVGDEQTDIKEIFMFTEVPSSNGTKKQPMYQPDDPKIMFWDQATPDEIKYLGTNMLIQPNPSKLGTIMNHYGDIYTKRNFYDALEKYKDIEEPEIICSKEW